MLPTPAIGLSNPVLTKELRTRMRGARAYWVLFTHVVLLSVVLFFTYLFQYQRLMGAGFRPSVGADPVGRLLFQALFSTQAVMLSLITPALTAGMITIEREQRTYELLMLTILRPREIAAGKLLSAFGFAVLLLTASLPLAGVCFMMGGVSPWEILVVYLLLAASSLFYGSLGLLFSAMLRTTSVATATTYTVAFLVFGVTAALGAGQKDVLFSAVNPVWAALFTLQKGPFFRWHVWAWVPALLFNLLAALMAAAGAVHRLEEGVSERPGTLRFLTYAFFTVMAVGIMGNVTGLLPHAAGSDDLRTTTAVLSGVLLISLVMLTIVFCAGGKEDFEKAGASGHQPDARRPGLFVRIVQIPIFGGGYSTAPGYVMLLYVTGGALLAGSFAIAGITTWALILDTLATALLVALVPVLLCVSLTRLCSLVTENRNIAALLTTIILGALMLLPLLSLIGWDSSVKQPHSLAWETLYLVPVWAFLALGGSPSDWKSVAPPVWASQVMFPIVTLLLYLAMAVAAELAGQIVRRRRSRRTSG